jgi:hypothetical protein
MDKADSKTLKAIYDHISNYIAVIAEDKTILWINKALKTLPDLSVLKKKLNTIELKPSSSFETLWLSPTLHEYNIIWKIEKLNNKEYCIISKESHWETKVRSSLIDTGIGYGELDLDKQLFILSPSLSQLLQLDKKSTLSIDDFLALHSEKKRPQAQQWLSKLRANEITILDSKLILPNKCNKYFQIQANFKYQENNTKYFYLLFKDQTQLKEVEARFKGIFQYSPLGMILYDKSGESIHVNRAFKQMIDLCETQEHININLYNDPNIPEFYRNLIEDHQIVSFEGPADYLFLHSSPDPDEISFKIFNYTISPIGNQYSDFSGYVAIISDFTERRLHDQEIINTREQALEADQLKSAFLANMSHEIRTPMNAIMGFSELLEYDGYSEEDRKLFIRTINDNGKYLLNLINDIIDFSKIEANQLSCKWYSDSEKNYVDLINSNALRLSSLLEDIFMFTKAELNKAKLMLTEFPLLECIVPLVEKYRILAESKQLGFNFPLLSTLGDITINSNKEYVNKVLTKILIMHSCLRKKGK